MKPPKHFHSSRNLDFYPRVSIMHQQEDDKVVVYIKTEYTNIGPCVYSRFEEPIDGDSGILLTMMQALWSAYDRIVDLREEGEDEATKGLQA